MVWTHLGDRSSPKDMRTGVICRAAWGYGIRGHLLLPGTLRHWGCGCTRSGLGSAKRPGLSKFRAADEVGARFLAEVLCRNRFVERGPVEGGHSTKPLPATTVLMTECWPESGPICALPAPARRGALPQRGSARKGACTYTPTASGVSLGRRGHPADGFETCEREPGRAPVAPCDGGDPPGAQRRGANSAWTGSPDSALPTTSAAHVVAGSRSDGGSFFSIGCPPPRPPQRV